MATNNKTSALVESLLPEFLDDEGPKFQAFVRAYYEWLETTNQVTDRSKNLLNYQDIDKTADEFLEYFKREILSSFPQSILADKSLVYKRIKDLYKAKGTEEAYRLLFRILYDEEIEFYYPGDDILRASDGRWTQDTTVRISAPFVGATINLQGRNIVGVTSGATAKVDRITSTFESGVQVYELFLSSIVGTFVDEETVRDDDNEISGQIISSVGPLTGVNVSFGGSGHQLNDAVTFLSASGVNANGNITRTVDNSLDISVLNGGSGYTVGTPLTIIGGGGSGAVFTVGTITDTEVLNVYNDIIEPFQNVPIDTGPTFVSTGANTSSVSANLASSNVSSILSAALRTTNTTIGTISSLSITSRGSNYTSLPTVTARSEAIASQNLPDGSGGIKGFNATFTPERAAGSISAVSINNSGSGYNRSDIVTIVNNTRSANNGFGAPLVTGINQYLGAYVDTKGFLSWNNKLQDNYFYQEFSYVVRSTKAINVYRELSKQVNHPAGTKLFGEARVEANVSYAPTITSVIDQDVEHLQSIGPDASIGSLSVSYTITPPSIVSTEAVPSPEVLLNIDPQATGSTAIVSTDIEINMSLGGAELISITSGIDFGTIVLTETILPTSILSTELFGTSSLNYTIDPQSITSTSIIPTDIDVNMTLGGAELISITSTATLSTDSEVLHVGAGTLSNFLAEDVGDLSAAQIADYDSFTIDSLPGNRIFDGVGTQFTTQLSPGSELKIRALEELTVTVGTIDDANTLVITANVAYGNGDLAIVSSNTYFYI